jgi:RNA binding exosome subunit
MDKKEIGRLFSILSDNDKILEIVEKIDKERGRNVYEGFCGNPVDFFNLINQDAKEKFFELLAEEMNRNTAMQTV